MMDLFDLRDPDVYPEILRLRSSPPPAENSPNWLLETRAWIGAQYIPTPDTERLRQLYGVVRAGCIGQKRQWLGLNSPPVTGKSEMLCHFMLDIVESSGTPWRSRVDGWSHLPCIYVKASSRQQGRGILKAISRFAGLDQRGDEDDLMYRLIQRLPLLQTQVIVLDDAHNFRRASDVATTLTDSLRNIITLPVTFVMAGARLEESALLKQTQVRFHESAEQLRRRHTGMGLESMVLPESNAEFRNLCMAFGRRVRAIPGLTTSGLSDPKTLQRLNRRCGSMPGRALGTLKQATALAIEGDRDVTTERIIASLPDDEQKWHT